MARRSRNRRRSASRPRGRGGSAGGGDGGSSGGSTLYPGVYVEETSSGTRPIEGVGTSTAGFVGSAPDTPVPLWRRARPLLLVAAGVAAVVLWRRSRTDP